MSRTPTAKEISGWAVYHHFRKWSRDGSLERVWQHSILTIQHDLDLSVLNLDGSHALAKRGGEAVAYQSRKRAKPSIILPITDHAGTIVATTAIVAGNHHDAFDLKPHLQSAFKAINVSICPIAGAFFNADSGCDTQATRKIGFNHHVVPNIAENKATESTPSAVATGCSTPPFTKTALPANVLALTFSGLSWLLGIAGF